MNNELRAQLCKKFPENQIKQRKGAFGLTPCSSATKYLLVYFGLKFRLPWV